MTRTFFSWRVQPAEIKGSGRHARRRTRVGLLAAVLAATAGVAVAPAALVRASGSFVVNTTADGHGCAPSPGTCTLRGAIEAANASSGTNTITFSIDGTFKLTLGTLTISGAQALNLTGHGQTKTVVDGGGATPQDFVVDGSTTSVTMSGLTIRGAGGSQFNGGGIENNGNLTLTSTTVTNNKAGAGAGIANFATLNFTTGDISHNTATGTSGGDGGGVLDEPFAGGSFPGNATITNVDIHDNIAAGIGGGIAHEDGGATDPNSSVTLMNDTLRTNHAGSTGGGLDNQSFGTDALTNVTVSGNSAVGNGGGVHGVFDTLTGGFTMSSVTIANNTAGGTGGGISDTTRTTIRYTILEANTPSNCSSVVLGSGGHNMDNGTSCGFTNPPDFPSTNAMLLPLATNPGPTTAFVPETQALPANSPAVNVGGPDCPPPATDERGFPRTTVLDPLCDVGAFELQPGSPPPPPSKCSERDDRGNQRDEGTREEANETARYECREETSE